MFVIGPNPGDVTVEFRNQNHWSSQQPAGDFSCTFFGNNYSDVSLDDAGFIPATTASDDIIIGTTDGDDMVGLDTDLSDGLGTGIPTSLAYSSASGPDSIGELIPANTAIGFSTILFFELASAAADSCAFNINL